MKPFVPCTGKHKCHDDGTNCLICGKSLSEKNKLKQGIELLTNLALEQDYDNIEQFSAYVQKKLTKKINHARSHAGCEKQ